MSETYIKNHYLISYQKKYSSIHISIYTNRHLDLTCYRNFFYYTIFRVIILYFLVY